MTARLALCLAAALLAASRLHAAPAPAGDSASSFKPTAMLRVAPPEKILAEIRATAELIARFAPSEREAKEFVNATDAALEKALGPDWKKAIDVSRPILGFVTIAPQIEVSTYCLMVPVKDDAAFRKMLANLLPKLEDMKDGVIRFELPGARPPSGMPAYGYLRFANKHAYITVHDAAVVEANRIPTPEQIVAGDPNALLSAKVFVDRVPEHYRQMAVNGVVQFKERMQNAGGGAGGMRMGFGAWELLALGGQYFQLYPLAEPIVRDTQELTLNARYDRSKLNLTLDCAFKSQNGSELNKLTAAIQPPMSLFTQMIGTDPAARAIVRGTFPEDLRKLLVPKLEEVLKQAPNEVPVWGAFMQRLGEAAIPTIRDGEIDLGAALRGPGKEDRYGIVGGIRLKDAGNFEKNLREAVAALPKDMQGLFKLDATSVSGVKVHQVMLPPLPEPAKSIFGESTLFVTFRPDAILLGFGEGAMDGLKEGLTAKPQVAPQYLVEGSGKKLVPLVTKINAEAGKKFKDFLGAEIDRVPLMELAIEGGSELKIRFGNVLTMGIPAFIFVGMEARAQFQPLPPGAAPIAPPPPAQRRAADGVPAPPVPPPS